MKYSPVVYGLILIVSTLLLSCAKSEAPSGGPEDKTPPDIISVLPKAGSVNVPLDTQFEIIFSKNMSKSTTENAVFISPLFFDYPEYKWSGKKLKIIPPEKLRENTTYVLTIGTQAIDTKNNKLGTSLSFPFSTGDQIYNGSIYGRVLSTGSQKLNVWAYKLESADPDTFWMKVPDYVTQPDSSGQFNVEYLGNGYYMVVAVEDKNSDQFWEPPGERLAMPDTIVYLEGERQKFGPLVLMTVDRDTLQPYISGARSPDDHSVIVEYTQAMDSADVLSTANYKVISLEDSTQVVQVELAIPLTFDFKSVYLRCSQLTTDLKYQLKADSIRSTYKIEADTISRIFAAGVVDTIRPELVEITPPSSKKPRQSGFTISLSFSEPMDTAKFGSKFAFADSMDNPVAFSYSWPYLNKVVLMPEFNDDDYYIFSYDERVVFDLVGNPLGDSLKEYVYITATLDSLGQIVGRVTNAPGSEVFINVLPKQGDKIVGKVKADGTFYVDRLFPGVYRLQAFYDHNNNGIFDGGGIRPLKYAEPIAIYSDTVQVRARWETDIGSIDFKPQMIDVDTLH